MKLWVLRHAQTVAAPGVCYGATDVEALAAQTHAAAGRFAPLVPVRGTLHSSPLRRCARLAQALEACDAGLNAQFDPRLAEMDFGAWEGRPWQEIALAELDAWADDFANARAGSTGESTRLFMHRVGAAWDDWCASGRDAVWVTHAGVIRAVLLLQQGVRCVERADQWPAQAIGFGQWVVIERE